MAKCLAFNQQLSVACNNSTLKKKLLFRMTVTYQKFCARIFENASYKLYIWSTHVQEVLPPIYD
jgi:hypothetical protein